MGYKVAIVTGANKGIGLAIVRSLCKRFDGHVYLTSRDESRGRAAVEELNKEGLHPKYHQLDVTDNKSIETFRDFIKDNHEGIDVLINNAAISFTFQSDPPEFVVQVVEILRVNYFSILTTCDLLFPLLKKRVRVVNVSSSSGHLSKIPSQSLRNRFKDPELTIPELSDMMNRYIEEATVVSEWGNSPYAVSKVGLTALTIIQQRILNDKDIKVNAVHPGYVDTDLTAHKGPLTIDEGAEAPLYLALDATDSIRGQFVCCDKTVVNWDGEMAEIVAARS